ncbi:MAG: hypothetical protein FWE91_07115 [Defluviitaleaceae bacterium]|nr:hypothetical protein [Defluviitaleaceae bacterium]MCL2836694.1 hypothetical protein [Defluviitaleaceae bacterium]
MGKINIEIGERNWLIVSDPEDLTDYGRITLYSGGFIEIRIPCEFNVDELVYEDEDGLGRDSNKWKHDIVITGNRGENSSKGENGKDGGNAPDVKLTIGKLNDSIKILNTGGRGGDGGDGADGQMGGNGGNGASGIGPGDGGDGGDGGRGQTGGNGGDGGNGGKVAVNYKADEGVGITGTVSSAPGGIKGIGGRGGKGGKGGRGGIGETIHGADGKTGRNGPAGRDGQNGTAGSPGSIAIYKNNVLESSATEAAVSPLAASIKSGITRVDYSDPEVREATIAEFGGIENYRENYPALYESFANTCELHRLLRNEERFGDTAENVLMFCSMSDLKQGNNANSGYITTNLSYGLEYSPLRQDGRSVTGARLEGSLIQVKTGRELDALDIRVTADELLLPNTHMFEAFLEDLASHRDQYVRVEMSMTVYYIDKDKKRTQDKYNLDNNDAAMFYKIGKSASNVQEIIVCAPKAKTDMKKNPIIVGYARNFDTTDITYPNNWISGNTMKIMMPISGKVTFAHDIELEGCYAEHYKDAKIEYRPHLYLSNDTQTIVARHCRRQADFPGYFCVNQAQKNIVDFTFNDDWNTSTEYNKYIYDSKLKVGFYCHLALEGGYVDTHADGKRTATGEVFLASYSSTKDTTAEYYISKQKRTCSIPEIQIIWGCFGRDTLLRMEDGSRKWIQDVKTGDRVAVEGGYAAITGTSIGFEQTLIRVETEDGKALCLTAGHPVLTERGYVRARVLKPGDALKTACGGSTRVLSAAEAAYEDNVYNVELDTDKALDANGLLAGDITAQNERLPDDPAIEEAAADMQLIEELEKLAR